MCGPTLGGWGPDAETRASEEKTRAVRSIRVTISRILEYRAEGCVCLPPEFECLLLADQMRQEKRARAPPPVTG